MSVERGVIRIDRPQAAGVPFPLGQHLVLDGRSLDYAVERDPALMTRPLRSVEHDIHIDVLNQDQVGSCAGNTGTEELACDPIWSTLPDDVKKALDETYAVGVYSDATKVDGYRGVYPPTDTGTSGLAVQKVLRARKLIASYRWATTLRGLVTQLQDGPVAWGTPWHRGMFTPDSSGFVTPTGPVDGGHEILLFAVDVKNADSDLSGTVFTFRNHWAASWGDHGCGRVRIDAMTQLRREGCDYKQGMPKAA